MLTFRVSAGADVVVVFCHERALRESDVGFFFARVVFSRHCGLVNDPFYLAYSREWADFLLAAIPLFGCSRIA